MWTLVRVILSETLVVLYRMDPSTSETLDFWILGFRYRVDPRTYGIVWTLECGDPLTCGIVWTFVRVNSGTCGLLDLWYLIDPRICCFAWTLRRVVVCVPVIPCDIVWRLKRVDPRLGRGQ